MIVKQRALSIIIWALLLAAGGAFIAGCGRSSSVNKPWPAVIVEATYAGANARVVEDTVAAPIEQQVNGVDKLVSMSSRCADDGSYTLTVTFERGVDLNMTQLLVQNRVNLAVPMLPELVKSKGLTVKQRPAGIQAILFLFSPNASRDVLYLSNYANIQLKDELARAPGIGEVLLIGQQDYSLRIWLDPDKITARNLTATDVIKAIEQQHVQVAGGATGQPPDGKGPSIQIPLTTLGRLADVEQLADIILKTGAGGQDVRLRDVANVQMGASHADRYASLDGKQGVAISIYSSPPARPRELNAALQNVLSQLRDQLPEGVDVVEAFDFTPNLETPDKAATPEYLLLEPGLPAGASTERTRSVCQHCEAFLTRMDEVQHVLTMSDNPFDRSHNRVCMLVRLAPASKRQAGREQLRQIIRTRLEVEVPEITLRLRDLSGASRFPRCGYPIDLAVHGTEGNRVRELAGKLVERLRASNKLTDLSADRESTPQPQICLDIDRTAAKDRGVAKDNILKTLQVFFGSLDVNDFNRFGRTWQVTVHAKPELRMQIEDIKLLKVRNANGEMVPLSTFVALRETEAAGAIHRLDFQPMVEITANPVSSMSLAQARTLCENLVEEVRKELRLSAEYRLTWLQNMPAAK